MCTWLRLILKRIWPWHYCRRCTAPWHRCHITPIYTEETASGSRLHYGVHALCERCFAALTAEQRLPFYRQQWHLQYRTVDWPLIETAVMRGE